MKTLTTEEMRAFLTSMVKMGASDVFIHRILRALRYSETYNLSLKIIREDEDSKNLENVQEEYPQQVLQNKVEIEAEMDKLIESNMLAKMGTELQPSGPRYVGTFEKFYNFNQHQFVVREDGVIFELIEVNDGFITAKEAGRLP